jgi:hypothetical protein
VAVIVSTTLQDLTAAAGTALTGSGTLLPMPDLIRMASRAYHYLAVFDKHTQRPLYLARSRRIANPDQRLVLYASERGCTHPAATYPPTAAKSTTPTTGPTAATPTSTPSPWPAAPTTNSPQTAGPQQNSPPTTPPGPHHHHH